MTASNEHLFARSPSGHVAPVGAVVVQTDTTVFGMDGGEALGGFRGVYTVVTGGGTGAFVRVSFLPRCPKASQPASRMKVYFFAPAFFVE